MKDRFGYDWSGLTRSRFWQRPVLGRRLFFRHMATAVGGYFLLPGQTPDTVAHAAAQPIGTAKNCIFILLAGGPSHVDTFDLKEGAWTPAELAPETYGSIRFPRGLMPNVAERLDSAAIIRSCRAWAAVHQLAQTWVQIGRNPTSGLSRIAPHIGTVAALELTPTNTDNTLPAFISLNTARSQAGAGYFPAQYGPFFVNSNGSGLNNTSTAAIGAERFAQRQKLLLELEGDLREGALGDDTLQVAMFDAGARKLVDNPAVEQTFRFTTEESDRYGRSGFGNACLTAKNLLEAKNGARFIQITQGGWDHHQSIYEGPNSLFTRSAQFDGAFGPLVDDLKQAGLLDETLIVVLGEFGRTVDRLNAQAGRDHYLQHSVLFIGGGVNGGKVIGSTDAAGRYTKAPGWHRDRDVRPEDIEATIYSALGIDWTKIRYDDPLKRGFYYVPESDKDVYGPVSELFG